MKDYAHLLLLRAFTGCDSTSAAYRKSKVGFVKMYQKSKIIQYAAERLFFLHLTPLRQLES